MSLVGFRAENHPQQVGKRAAQDAVDDRETAPEHFAAFDAEFGPFTLDVAAAPHNAKCEQYVTREQDGLRAHWTGVVWCNPPYSDIGAWVKKAWHEWDIMRRRHPWSMGNHLERIVMLLPANRTEQKWWQEHVEPHRSRPDFGVRFLPGRMRFIRPSAVIGPKGDRPPFGCCLLVWGGVHPGVPGRQVSHNHFGKDRLDIVRAHANRLECPCGFTTDFVAEAVSSDAEPTS